MASTMGPAAGSNAVVLEEEKLFADEQGKVIRAISNEYP